MSTPSRFAIGLLVPLFFFSAILSAREQAVLAGLRSSPVITAAAAGEKVRFSAPPGGAQIRVQILSASGDPLFDSAWKDGNVLDWPMDSAAQPLASGSYRCLVMVRDLEGGVTQKEATPRTWKPRTPRCEISSTD